MIRYAVLILLCLLSAVQVQAANVSVKHILAQAPGLTEKALTTALDGYHWALKRGEVKKPGLLTVIDFDLPSSDKRLWLIDLNDNKVLMGLHTTQGRNSGLILAKHFSNQPKSYETSLGVYTTGATYYGEHGYSLRLNGLESGINNNARARDIVVHPAWYVTKQFVDTYHRTGRSLGCFALNPAKARHYIQRAQQGSVIFAYASVEDHDPNFT